MNSKIKNLLLLCGGFSMWIIVPVFILIVLYWLALLENWVTTFESPGEMEIRRVEDTEFSDDEIPSCLYQILHFKDDKQHLKQIIDFAVNFPGEKLVFYSAGKINFEKDDGKVQIDRMFTCASQIMGFLQRKDSISNNNWFSTFWIRHSHNIDWDDFEGNCGFDYRIVEKNDTVRIYLQYSELNLENLAAFWSIVKYYKMKKMLPVSPTKRYVLVNKNGQEDCEVIYKDKSLFTINILE